MYWAVLHVLMPISDYHAADLEQQHIAECQLEGKQWLTFNVVTHTGVAATIPRSRGFLLSCSCACWRTSMQKTEPGHSSKQEHVLAYCIVLPPVAMRLRPHDGQGKQATLFTAGIDAHG